MPRFRLTYVCEEVYELEVEAATKEEAEEIAEEITAKGGMALARLTQGEYELRDIEVLEDG